MQRSQTNKSIITTPNKNITNSTRATQYKSTSLLRNLHSRCLGLLGLQGDRFQCLEMNPFTLTQMPIAVETPQVLEAISNVPYAEYNIASPTTQASAMPPSRVVCVFSLTWNLLLDKVPRSTLAWKTGVATFATMAFHHPLKLWPLWKPMLSFFLALGCIFN